MKRTPLARVGRKAKSKRVARAKVIIAVRERDRVCQFNHYVDLHSREPWDYPHTCIGPLDCHEVVPRSVWPDGELVESNVVLICRRHHAFIDDHLADARVIGLHRFSYERPT